MVLESVDIECPACGGTGVYMGFAEQDGAARVCYRCKGTGASRITFTRFNERKRHPDVRMVFRGSQYVVNCESAGGIAYEDWLNGTPLPEAE